MKAKDVVEAIDKAYLNKKKEKPRQYLGASIVGDGCTAYLSLSLRGFQDTPPDPKLMRIFEDGHRIEDRVVKDLVNAGFDVSNIDGFTGKQHAFQKFGGHFSGHADGIIIIDDQDHLLEIKSMNEGRFKDFVRQGVRSSHPKYYAQMQAMMGMSGLRRAMFIAYNKNTSEYHVEFIEFDEFYYSGLEAKVEGVLAGSALRISEDDTDWRCRACFKRDACWNPSYHAEITATNGATCAKCMHSLPSVNGQWHCNKHDREALEICGDWSLFKVTPK